MSFGAFELLLVGFIGLIGLGCTGLWAAAGQARLQKLQLRIAALGPTRRSHFSDATTATRLSTEATTGSRRQRAELLFGLHPGKRDRYPVPFAYVCSAALLAGLAGAWAISIIAGNIALVLFPALWVMASRVFYKSRDQRYAAELSKQLPDTLSMIVRAVRVGVPVSEALHTISQGGFEPTGKEFRRLVDEVRMGVPLAVGIKGLADRSGLPEYRFFATAMALQSQTGGPLSDTLQNLADLIRTRSAVKARGRALSSEARASATVLAIVPVLIGLVLFFTNRPYLMILFTDPAGQKVLGAAVLSLSTGMTIMRLMIRRALS